MSTPFVEIKFQTKGVEYVALVSPEDEERVRAVRWRLWDRYAHNADVGLMHSFIMGERPADVPKDYVIDHRDRNKFNNMRDNLRWVPEAFNSWNHERPRKGTYRGVAYNAKVGRWYALLCNKSYGMYILEKDAGRAYAKACVQKYGKLAATSDILLGSGPGKFSAEEIAEIEAEIAAGDIIDVSRSRTRNNMPTGVRLTKSGRYQAYSFEKRLGMYDTIEAAKAAYDYYVKEKHDRAWAAHVATDITRDSDGHAVIHLSGVHGTGLSTKVPEKFWYQLTFNRSWSFGKEYATGSNGVYLHAVIWELLNPGYKPVKGISIDHINPAAKLDNREENLRLASVSGQARNKQKREGCSSKHIGVVSTKDGYWRGEFRFEGRSVAVRAKTEDLAYERLIEKKKEFGVDV